MIYTLLILFPLLMFSLGLWWGRVKPRVELSMVRVGNLIALRIINKGSKTVYVRHAILNIFLRDKKYPFFYEFNDDTDAVGPNASLELKGISDKLPITTFVALWHALTAHNIQPSKTPNHMHCEVILKTGQKFTSPDYPVSSILK